MTKRQWRRARGKIMKKFGFANLRNIKYNPKTDYIYDMIYDGIMFPKATGS